MKIYSLTGDDGFTFLSGGERVPKHHPRVEAYGTIDELIAWIGLLRDVIDDEQSRNSLLTIQDGLMKSAAVLACVNPQRGVDPPTADSVLFIEKEIDTMEQTLPVLRNFILPGGGIKASYCHVARAVCRRAERNVLRLKEGDNVPDLINKFLNRLSDYLFVLARKVGYNSGYKEISWPI